jgi:hypothetical protein
MSRKDFEQKQPVQFGDLHERMHYLIELICRPENVDRVPIEVSHAIWDLKTEVEGYAALPSFGRKIVNI